MQRRSTQRRRRIFLLLWNRFVICVYVIFLCKIFLKRHHAFRVTWYLFCKVEIRFHTSNLRFFLSVKINLVNLFTVQVDDNNKMLKVLVDVFAYVCRIARSRFSILSSRFEIEFTQFSALFRKLRTN